MAQVLCQLPTFQSERLLIGFDSSDDAAVYQLNDEQALIQTLDFFTPIVDDPYLFGQVAATNALSDVYAMGGSPIVALNIVGFPSCLEPNILAEILKGGADKVKEAGALLVGGHSIEDHEPKYGLSVSGIVHPKKIWANNAPKEGDILILTKPLGVGILTTAMKENLVSEETSQEVIHSMITLNKYAAEIGMKYDIHSCTDITGFGLIGHLLEMCKDNGVTVTLNHKNLPIIHGAFEMAQMGIIPGGAYRNRAHVGDAFRAHESVDEAFVDICFDPQTSGGLLFSVSKEVANDLIHELKESGCLAYHAIGEVKRLDDVIIQMN